MVDMVGQKLFTSVIVRIEVSTRKYESVLVGASKLPLPQTLSFKT